jgi:hypothetical protein
VANDPNKAKGSATWLGWREPGETDEGDEWGVVLMPKVYGGIERLKPLANLDKLRRRQSEK